MSDILDKLRAFYENAETDECLYDIRKGPHMNDIVEELRAAAADTNAVKNASVAYLLEHAAGEIELLRLAQEEREAIESAIWDYEQNDDDEDCARRVSTLRGLLDRTKTC
jgi:hypothetical protein